MYHIMNKDLLVAELSTDKSSYNAFNMIVHGKLPWGYQSFMSWLMNRETIIVREDLDLIKNGSGILDEFIDKTHCVSLNDTFWVKRADDTLQWNDVSPYRNIKSDRIYDIVKYANSSGLIMLSCKHKTYWTRDTLGNIRLIKRKSASEALTEFYVGQVAKVFKVPYVKYEVLFDGDFYSSCKLFTSEDMGYVPFDSLLDDDRYIDCEDEEELVKRLGFTEEYNKMIVVDSITLNKGRNNRNTGVLVDNMTGEILKFAPYFDSDNSLLSDEECEDLISHLSTSSIRGFFLRNAKHRLNEDIKKSLDDMKDFKFESDCCLFSPVREQSMTKLVRYQAGMLNNIKM